MALARTHGPKKAVLSLVTGRRIKSMGRGRLSMLMGANTVAHSSRARNRAMASLNGKTVGATEAATTKISSMVMASLSGRMAGNMLAAGKKVNNMVVACLSRQMAVVGKAFGHLVSSASG